MSCRNSQYRTFDQFRRDSGPNEFASAVCQLPLFLEMRRRAAAGLAAHWPNHTRLDDAVQDALLSISDYLTKTQGRDFQGTTDEQLGGWFSRLCRRHMVWALCKGNRGDKRRRIWQQTSARSESQAVLSEHQYETAQQIAARVIAGLPEPERTVAHDYQFDVPAAETASACKIRKSTVFRLRKKALVKIIAALDVLP